MKKIISALLSLSLLVSVPVFAETDMETALKAVKEKAEIPAELSEFNSGVTDADKTVFSFTWNSPDDEKGVDISCDKLGRINSYYSWDNSASDGENRKMPHYTKKDAQNYAENLVKQLLPEAFSANDTLVCDVENSSGRLTYNGTSYRFTFDRKLDGIIVRSNTVTVNVRATSVGITASLNVSYDHNAHFEKGFSSIDDPETAYKKAFPLSLHYEKDYEKSKNSDEDITKLLYGTEELTDGYISAENGEKISEKPFYLNSDNKNHKNESTSEDAASGGSSSGFFSKQEITELEKMSELISAKDAEKKIRALSALKVTDKMTVDSSSIYKYDDTYFMNLHLTDNNGRYLSVSLNAETGMIYSIYNPKKGESENLTEKENSLSKEKIHAFFREVAPDICNEYTIDKENEDSISYIRNVNGIDYNNNRANITYNSSEDMITGYNITYTKAVFDNPSDAVPAEDAYSSLLNSCPIIPVYILTSSGKYELCYGISGTCGNIDALSGTMSETAKSFYTDIDGHWCENAVKMLSEVGIRLNGNEFRPNEQITLSDLLTLFSAGIERNGAIPAVNDILPQLKKNRIINDDTDLNACVQREDAFLYMVKLAGYDRLAMLDIYKLEFPDADDVSVSKKGHTAILYGFGIIDGNDGYVRPHDNITRAEAAEMLYKYLINM